MKTNIYIILIGLLSCFTSYAQEWEVSIAPGGVSNYDNWGEDKAVHVRGYQYSFFVSGFRKFEHKHHQKKGNVHWYNGIGFSYSFHQANWVYKQSTGVFQPTLSKGYEAASGILGVELIPFVFDFKKGLEIRSGVQIGLLTHWDGNLSRSTFRLLNLQFQNRFSYDIPLKKYRLSPFYQFSTGIIPELDSAYIRPLLLHRHNIGITFGFGVKSDQNTTSDEK